MALLHGEEEPSRMNDHDMVKAGTMYAIAFDLDQQALEANYKNPSYKNAYADIGKILREHGFNHTQGSLYFGDPTRINAVTCMLAVVDLTKRCAPWFSASVTDIRMLRIEDNNDLLPVVAMAAGSQPAAAPATGATAPAA